MTIDDIAKNLDANMDRSVVSCHGIVKGYPANSSPTDVSKAQLGVASSAMLPSLVDPLRGSKYSGGSQAIVHFIFIVYR